jgi:hypothetical protein
MTYEDSPSAAPRDKEITKLLEHLNNAIDNAAGQMHELFSVLDPLTAEAPEKAEPSHTNPSGAETAVGRRLESYANRVIYMEVALRDQRDRLGL